MFHIKDNQMDFVDCYVERRIRKNTFFKQINTLIPKCPIENISLIINNLIFYFLMDTIRKF